MIHELLSGNLVGSLIEAYPVPFAILAVVGLSTMSKYLISLFHVAYENHLMRGISLKKYGAGDRAYAVITGATDGIGKELAKQMAKEKMNLFLISRTLEKLHAVAREISAESGVDVRVHALDFTKATAKDFSELRSILSSLPVTVLVNNVATNHVMPTPFAEESLEVLDNIVHVNIYGTLRMTRTVLPEMLARRNGLILNVGSFAGEVPTPLLQTYSGSKAFLRTWSEALAAEVKSQGVRVQLLNTYFVMSNMSKIKKPSALIPTARGYVKHVMRCLGAQAFTTPYPYHNLAHWFLSTFAPREYLIKQTLQMQQSIRKRALRKAEREAKAQ